MLESLIREETRLVREPEQAKGCNCLLRILSALNGAIIKAYNKLRD